MAPLRAHEILDQLHLRALAGFRVGEVGGQAATADFGRVCCGGQLDLWEHVAVVLAAMQGAAEALEHDGRLAATAAS